MSDTAEGECACGAVRYRLESGPMIVHCCHCLDCQRQTGTAFATNALIESSRVTVLAGETEAVQVPTDSGLPHIIVRCPTCRTALWSYYGGRDTMSFVRVGTLDDPSTMPPGVHIYTRSKVPWVTLPEGVPAFTDYYDARQVWSADSLERRRALPRPG